MIIIDYKMQPSELHNIAIPMQYVPHIRGNRTFVITEDIKFITSDGREVIVEKGFDTDLASVPSWAWSLFKPIDEAFAADLLHDKLWSDKQQEIQRLGSVYSARKYADNERNLWRKKFANKRKIKNFVTHFIIRLFGGLMYSGQMKIPI